MSKATGEPLLYNGADFVHTEGAALSPDARLVLETSVAAIYANRVVLGVEFEWDEAKSRRNFETRGIGYDAAALIFDGPVIEWCDVRELWGEARVVAVGSVEGAVLAVVYTDRGDVRRIISARKARTQERKLWQWSVDP